tara:strand:- start:1120 stop:1497 length:378 start_codon:yes stop_codon:yes gene_type:complete
MKNIIKTALVLLAMIIGVYVIQRSIGFPPSDATGSAIKGVQKANKYKIEDDTEVELVGENFQIFLQNDEVQEILVNKDLNEFINTVAEAGLDTAKLGDYKGLVSNKEFVKLYNTNTFSTLAKLAK